MWGIKSNWQFRDDAAERFAYVIRENYELANLRDFSGSSLGADKKISQEVKPPKPPPPPSLEISSTMRKANLLLGNNREILIYIPNDLTEEEFKRIPSWLEI
jgi:hypothetical protein